MSARRSRAPGASARRWSAGRVVLLVVGIVAALLGIAAGLAVWLLPPVLADTARERFTVATPVDLLTASGTATVTADPGWVVVGVGPFLPDDSAVLISPDDAYRAELTALPVGAGTDVSASDDFAALLEAHGQSGAALDAAGWHAETLRSGVAVRYATVPGAGDLPDTTVAVATGEQPRVALVLIAMMPAGEAARYRTVTAALLSSATFAAPRTDPPGASDRVADFGAISGRASTRSPQLEGAA